MDARTDEHTSDYVWPAAVHIASENDENPFNRAIEYVNAAASSYNLIIEFSKCTGVAF